MNYECPCCGEWLEVRELQQFIDCPTCQTRLTVDADADFDNGHWRDRTKLIPVETPVDADAAEAFDQLEYLDDNS